MSAKVCYYSIIIVINNIMFLSFLLQIFGVSLAVRGCGLNRFLPPIILSVCVYMWTCLCIVRSSFKMHIHTLVHTCILPKLTQPVCRTPNHDYKLKCEELFFILVLICFIHVHFFFSFVLVSTR